MDRRERPVVAHRARLRGGREGRELRRLHRRRAGGPRCDAGRPRRAPGGSPSTWRTRRTRLSFAPWATGRCAGLRHDARLPAGGRRGRRPGHQRRAIFTPLRWNEADFAEQLRHASPSLVVVAYAQRGARAGPVRRRVRAQAGRLPRAHRAGHAGRVVPAAGAARFWPATPGGRTTGARSRAWPRSSPCSARWPRPRAARSTISRRPWGAPGASSPGRRRPRRGRSGTACTSRAWATRRWRARSRGTSCTPTTSGAPSAGCLRRARPDLGRRGDGRRVTPRPRALRGGRSSTAGRPRPARRSARRPGPRRRAGWGA